MWWWLGGLVAGKLFVETVRGERPTDPLATAVACTAVLMKGMKAGTAVMVRNEILTQRSTRTSKRMVAGGGELCGVWDGERRRRERAEAAGR